MTMLGQLDDDVRGPRDWVEVRVLGPLRVRLPDGTRVQDRDWRTGKNADLLRWLALEAGAPVGVDVLTDGLWPEADEARGRSSLRTAVAHLRRVLGASTVERVADGLLLTGCWVDAPAFSQHADDVDRHRRAGRHAEAFTTALEADALYVADLAVGDGAPEALGEHAHALTALHHRLLGDAAESALEMGWLRDAVDFALRLRDIDPTAERASRVLMLGWAGMGEQSRALQEYERCRRALADELGVDPSSQTQAAHLTVLSPVPVHPASSSFVGRTSELAWLEAALAGAGAPPVVVLSGADGSGRHRLAVEACRSAGRETVDVPPGASVEAAVRAAGGRVVVWRPDPDRDLPDLARLLSGAVGLDAAGAVVVLAPCLGERAELDEVLRPAQVRSLPLQPLLLDDVAALAAQVLSGPLVPSVVEELHRTSAGLPGRVLDLLREWASSGRLAATSKGLALTAGARPDDDDRSGRRALARALPRLEGDGLEAVQLAALLDQPITPSLLAPLLVDAPDGADDDVSRRARATAALEQLADLSLLRNSAAGAVWRHPLTQDAVRGWMRPVVAQRLHRRIAGQAPMPSAARVEHWLQAGERELACVAALDAAEECSSRGDHAGARTHLLEVVSLGDLPEASAEDRVDLYENLGDACGLLRRPEEARTAYLQALDIALARMLPQAARLRRKLDTASDPRALEVVPSGRVSDGSSVLGGDTATGAGADPKQVEAYLLDVIEQADRRHDQRRAVEARLQMASAVCLPRRDFKGVHRWVEAARRLDARPGDRLRAVLIAQFTPVLLGGAAAARAPLEEASRAAEAAGEERLRWHLLGMRVVVAHDLGLPEYEALWAELEQHVLHGPVDQLVPELAAIALRVLAEREELDGAATMASHLALAGGQGSLVLQHLARLASSELASAVGEHRQAADLLRGVVEEGRATGCTLLVPEAAARLVVLEAEHDWSAARAAFDTYDEVVGATVGGPREEFFRRLSRAAVRAAHGDLDGAAGACASASSLASQHGLQVLAARARRCRAEHLRAMGPPRTPGAERSA